MLNFTQLVFHEPNSTWPKTSALNITDFLSHRKWKVALRTVYYGMRCDVRDVRQLLKCLFGGAQLRQIMREKPVRQTLNRVFIHTHDILHHSTPCTHTHTHKYIYIYIYIYTHTHINIYTHTYTHTQRHTHTHKYIYIYIYIHTHTHT